MLAMAEPEERRRFRLGWSVWRRVHQALAARCRRASHAARDALGPGGSSKDRARTTVTVLAPEGAPLTDAEWERVRSLLPHRPPAGRSYHDHRTVLGGILWVARSGSSWREMPEEFGKWERAYRRYELWLEQGLWQRILEALGEETLPGPATKAR